MKNIQIYTDGACSGNPGLGGWACVLLYNGTEKRLSGGENQTTNNRMELLAVIKALEALNQPCNVDLYSDSAYVVNAFLQDWISSWVLNNWKTKGKDPVKNVELWQKLIALTHTHNVTWHKVKGHSDNQMNNLCDMLARGEIDKLRKAEV